MGRIDETPPPAKDADIPATIARDTEVTAAVSTHEAAADPHPGYQKESEKNAANGYAGLDGSGLLTDGLIPAAIARDAEVTAALYSVYGAFAGDVDGATSVGFTSLFLLNFVAPPSGAVIVTADGAYGPQDSDSFVRLVVNAADYSMGRLISSGGTDGRSRSVRVAGLTPGNGYTADVQWKGSNFHCRASSLPDYEFCSILVRAAA